MEEWEDWLYLFRHYINAKISAPARAPEEYKGSDHQIELFTKMCSSDIMYNEALHITQLLMLLTFNYTHGKNLTYQEFQGNHYYTNKFYCINK